jgi:hypothetical protein
MIRAEIIRVLSFLKMTDNGFTIVPTAKSLNLFI